MTTVVKGFVTINAYVNNTPGQISTLGELSTWSRTYSKEKGEYLSDAVPGFKLTTFKVADLSTGVQQVVPQSLVKQALEVVSSCINYATSHIRPYDSIDFKNTLLTNFFQKMGDLQVGVFADNGAISLPEWLSWKSLDNNDTIVKIWLSDAAFQDQYDEYEIVVIPPVDNVDFMFSDYNVALSAIQARTMAQLSDKIQVIKGDNPETYLRLMDFDYVNRININQKNKSTWATLIYGKTGDNIDSIKDAIVEFILANSVHTKPEWEVVLPDVFKRTEFVLIPRWDKIAIPNLGDLANLYSSMMMPSECVSFAKSVIDFYDDAFIDNNVTVFPYDYKGLSVVAVNGNTNTVGFETLSGLYSDYIPVPSTSADFNRMQLRTRDWMIFVEKLLIIAETVTVYSSVPLFARKQYRNGIMFISGMHNNVNYLVAAKSNAIFIA